MFIHHRAAPAIDVSKARCSRGMVEVLHSRDRLPIVAAFLSPLVGLPLLGPWILDASVADDSPAKPHIARAFDVHLLSTLLAIATWFTTIFIWGYDVAEIVGAAVLIVGLAGSFVLLIGIVRNAKWSAPWQPIFLGDRKFYHQESYRP